MSGRVDLSGDRLENEGSPWGNGRGGGGGPAEGGSGLGPRNPWTEPPPTRKPGGKPTLSAAALEEVLRRGRDRFGGKLPGARDPSFWAWGVGVIVLLWVLLTSIHRIDPSQRGVVLRLGQYQGVLTPGLKFTLPAPIDRILPVDVEHEAAVDVGSSTAGGEALLVTRDLNLVDVAFQLRWKVRDPVDFVFNNRPKQAEDAIRDVAESVMRAEVARLTLREAVGVPAQAALPERAQVATQRVLDAYAMGVTVSGIKLRRLSPPAELEQAGKQVQAAVRQAAGEETAARTAADDAVARAQAQAEEFNRTYDEYRLAPELTRTRMYYDMMDEVLPKLDVTITDGTAVQPTLPVSPGRAAAAEAPR